MLSPANEDVWLSKDIDFGGVFGDELLAALPVVMTDGIGGKYPTIAGVRIGYIQAGVTINPEEALGNARIGLITMDGRPVKFLVADPLTLYFEKSRLMQTRSQQNDWFHLSLLHSFICYELVTGGENWLRNEKVIDVVDVKQILGWWLKVANKAPEILKDPRIKRRLHPLLTSEHPIAKCLSQVR